MCRMSRHKRARPEGIVKSKGGVKEPNQAVETIGVKPDGCGPANLAVPSVCFEVLSHTSTAAAAAPKLHNGL